MKSVQIGLYFPVLSPNTGKHRPEKTPYLDTFHAVKNNEAIIKIVVSEWEFHNH